jgi:hypothetical protein
VFGDSLDVMRVVVISDFDTVKSAYGAPHLFFFITGHFCHLGLSRRSERLKGVEESLSRLLAPLQMEIPRLATLARNDTGSKSVRYKILLGCLARATFLLRVSKVRHCAFLLSIIPYFASCATERLRRHALVRICCQRQHHQVVRRSPPEPAPRTRGARGSVWGESPQEYNFPRWMP